MNKPVLVAGFLFWAGLSGVMGLRLLEGYVEDAVSAALSSIPAKAEEVKFSYLTKKVTLKNIDFEIPLEKEIFKGNIESLTIQGFNKKVLFVFPDMPQYDAQNISPVAKSVHFKSLKGNYHSGFTEINFSVNEINLTNWKQRLGILLDHYARKGVKNDFFSELGRCSLENALAHSITVKGNNTKNNQKVEISASELGIQKGVQPALNNEGLSPVPLTIKNMSVHIERDGNGQRIFNRDYPILLVDSSSNLLPLINLTRSMLLTDDNKEDITKILDKLK